MPKKSSSKTFWCLKQQTSEERFYNDTTNFKYGMESLVADIYFQQIVLENLFG